MNPNGIICLLLSYAYDTCAARHEFGRQGRRYQALHSGIAHAASRNDRWTFGGDASYLAARAGLRAIPCMMNDGEASK